MANTRIVKSTKKRRLRTKRTRLRKRRRQNQMTGTAAAAAAARRLSQRAVSLSMMRSRLRLGGLRAPLTHPVVTGALFLIQAVTVNHQDSNAAFAGSGFVEAWRSTKLTAWPAVSGNKKKRQWHQTEPGRSNTANMQDMQQEPICEPLVSLATLSKLPPQPVAWT